MLNGVCLILNSNIFYWFSCFCKILTFLIPNNSIFCVEVSLKLFLICILMPFDVRFIDIGTETITRQTIVP